MNGARGRGWFGRAEAAIAGMAVAGAFFWVIGEDTEASLFGLAFLGLVAGRALGIPRNSLFVLALTIAVLIAVVLLGGLGHSRFTSTFAHFVVSAMFAWGLSQPVWARLSGEARPGGRRAVLILAAAVLVLGGVWEVGEQLADDLLGTGLSLGLTDVVLDLAADGLGGLGGAVVAARFSPPGGAPQSQPSRA